MQVHFQIPGSRSHSGDCKAVYSPFDFYALSINLTCVILLSVEEIAKKKGISMAQVAVAWSLGKEGECTALTVQIVLFSNSAIGVSAPIVGTTSLKNLEDLLGSHLRGLVLICTDEFVFRGPECSTDG